MRRIKLRYTGGPGSSPNNPPGDIFGRGAKQASWELIDLDTGLPIPYVQSLQFTINAETMLPELTLRLIPEEIEIEGPMLVHDLGGKRYYAGRQEVPMLKDAIFSWMPPVDREPAEETFSGCETGNVLQWPIEQPPEERRT